MKALNPYYLVVVGITFCSPKPSSFPDWLEVYGFQRDIASLSRKETWSPLYHRPEIQKKAVNALIFNTETLLAAKGEDLFATRYERSYLIQR